MNIIILSIKSKTGIALADRLSIPIVYSVLDIPDNIDLLIRWGNTAHITGEIRTVNEADSIKKVSDKAFSRKLFFDNNIPVPTLTEEQFPCIGRPTKHHAGRKFFICRNAQDIERAKRHGATYFSVYYPKQDEYRVHIGNGKTILVSEKTGRKENRMCWNHKKTGFIFRHMKRSEWLGNPKLMDVVKLAKRAIKLVGLNFGAVDIMANPTDDSMPLQVVSEINTCPSLSPLALEKYAKFFEKNYINI